MSSTYKVYTDGACLGNPGPGGWGVIILTDSNSEIKLCGSSKNTTNNIMELKAIINALKYLERFNNNAKVEFFSDSKYVVDGINIWLAKWKQNNWKNSENNQIKNLKLWKTIDKLLLNKEYSIKWVKAHDKDEYNIKVDKLAKSKIPKKN